MNGLRYEAVVSLDAGAVCPQCGEGKLDKEVTGTRLRCPVCSQWFRPFTRRFALKYPMVPSAPGHDVFVRTYATDPQGADLAMFAVDIDTGKLEDAETAYQALVSVSGPVVQMYFSGAKGHHLVIPLETWHYRGANWPSVFRNLTKLLGIDGLCDHSIYKHRAMLRAPNTTNTKTGKPKTLIRDAVSKTINPAWTNLVQQAQETAQNDPTPPMPDDEPWFFLQEFQPPCITKLWLDGLPYRGSRHMAYLHLASYYVRRGDAQIEAGQYLEDYASIFESNTETPEAARVSAAKRIIQSAYNNGLRFVCERGETLNVCEDTCPLFNKTTPHTP